jgi:uncharacterized Zn finger protein
MQSFTESDIRAGANAQSYSRGQSYYRDGSVLEVSQRDSIISADVTGSEYEPYQVTVILGEKGIRSANCTCPYELGGYCKHIVAVLLTVLNKVEDIEVQPSIETLLAGLKKFRFSLQPQYILRTASS